MPVREPSLRELNLPPADPNVKIPAGVKRAAERADAAFRAVNGDPVTSEGNQPPAPPVAAAEPSAVTPPPAPSATDQPPVVTPDAAEWERRYNSMKGRFDVATRKLTDQDTRLGDLERQIASLRTTPPAPTTTKLITPQEETDYGAEFLEVVGKKAKETIGGEVETLRKKVSDLESLLGQVTSTQVATSRKTLRETLTDAVPNWNEINEDDKFLDWLALPDVYSGGIRHDLLKQAFARSDTDRVIAFFKGFLSEEAAKAPAREGNPAPATTTASEPAPSKVSLETLAAPGRAKTPAASQIAPGEKPLISRAQITQFYTDVRRGMYRGRDNEKIAAEAEIFAAQREGRIR